LDRCGRRNAAYTVQSVRSLARSPVAGDGSSLEVRRSLATALPSKVSVKPRASLTRVKAEGRERASSAGLTNLLTGAAIGAVTATERYGRLNYLTSWSRRGRNANAVIADITGKPGMLSADATQRSTAR
jgi:hypothetical protein